MSKCPCEHCETRKFFAKRFDMHFYGEDCWYECEKYEQWKEKEPENDTTDSRNHPGD